jgi:hypothetical protein
MKDDEIALEKGTRTVSWTVTRKVAVGYHRCGVCGRWTPPPPPHVLEAVCRAGPSVQYLWPGDPGWSPEGWTHDDERGHVCPSCTRVKNEAWGRVKPIDRRIPPDGIGPVG